MNIPNNVTAYCLQEILPKSLIRLISTYIFQFKTDDAINDLLEYNTSKFENNVNSNIVFYYMNNGFSDSQENIKSYIASHILNMLDMILPNYNDNLIYVFEYMGDLKNVDKNCRTTLYGENQIQLNLLQMITVVICKSKNEKCLLDFTQKFNICGEMHLWNPDRKKRFDSS